MARLLPPIEDLGQMMRRVLAVCGMFGIFGIFGMLVSLVPQPVAACPFCSAIAQTFTEEIDATDVAVVARLLEAPPVDDAFDSTGELPLAKFELVEVLKGGEHLESAKEIEAIYFGSAKKGTLFMIMAVDPPKLAWSTPMQLTDRAYDYLQRLVKLPSDYAKSVESFAERLEFFLAHLEDEDEMLARDSYDEFARAPYDAVIALKPKMDHAQLVEWIQDTDIPATRRRLYFTMLGVRGGPEDLPMLEQLLRSDDRKQKAGLDALLGCYLTLKGADGMELVEELFIKNEEADYADTYAAIMAMRFHGTEGNVIPQERILRGFRLMLDRPKLADLVIPDLARWEDWESLPRLVRLFKESDEKTSWVRVPVVNYIRACPLPEAEEYLKELEEMDPVAVRRATTFFPLAPQPSGDESPALAPPTTPSGN
jgi:hypothetical protein